MARISGVDLPREKRVEIGLTYIYGIGRSTAQNILRETGVNPDIRVKDLSESDVNKLREYIDHHCKVEGDLRREVSMNIKRLIEVGCYRGVRHRKGLPFAVRARSRTHAPARVPSVPPVRLRNNQGGELSNGKVNKDYKEACFPQAS